MQIWTRKTYGDRNQKMKWVKTPFVSDCSTPRQVDDFFECNANIYSLVRHEAIHGTGDRHIVFSANEENGLRKMVEKLYLELDQNLTGFFNRLFVGDIHIKEKGIKVECGFVYLNPNAKLENRKTRLSFHIKPAKQ